LLLYGVTIVGVGMEMFEKILVPLDGAALAQAILPYRFW